MTGGELASHGVPEDAADMTERLRLELDDARFDRDRYRASAADYQAKFMGAMAEMEGLLACREQRDELRREMAAVAQEFEQAFRRRVAQLEASNAQQVSRAEEDCRRRISLTHDNLQREQKRQMQLELAALATEAIEKVAREIERANATRRRRWLGRLTA